MHFMLNEPVKLVFIWLFALSIPVSAQQPQVLTATEWRADLDQLDGVIREIHPRPFANVEEADYVEARAALHNEISALNDHEIMARMASLVGMLEDGHSRLSLPRAASEMAFSYSHSEDPAPTDAELLFGQLPVRFEALRDGLFVADAVAPHESLIGHRVVSIGGLVAGDALQAASDLVSGENPGGHQMLAADRLALSEALNSLGATERPCGTPIRLVGPERMAYDVCLSALDGSEDRSAAVDDAEIFRLRFGAASGVVLFELNQIGAGNAEFLSDAFGRAIAEAERSGARLAIDLRRNTGGDTSYGPALLIQLLQSPELNRFGRVFVLIGPRTFSAAQLLLNTLELNSRVLFVGEPSGARPDHFGDARKTRLDNSGLTLRVSTLHWSSGAGSDPRMATPPHIPVFRDRLDIIGERDSALEAVAMFEWPGVAPFVADQLRREQPTSAANIASVDALASSADDRASAQDFLRLSEELEAEGNLLAAAYMALIGSRSHPFDAALESRFEAVQERRAAQAQ